MNYIKYIEEQAIIMTHTKFVGSLHFLNVEKGENLGYSYIET